MLADYLPLRALPLTVVGRASGERQRTSEILIETDGVFEVIGGTWSGGPRSSARRRAA